ncbi:hypothetical protein [Burkholderia sp. LMG 32019]|uniref:hypothetical protein n=1 Tax=Burkholderia sp. LMG 32019 TaxID=3158173 RepID=UPI003C2CDBF8
MAEPLIIGVEAVLSRAAFVRWLALPIPSSGVDAILAERQGIADIGQLLASMVSADCHLMCRYDKGQKTLQLAIYLYDGSTSAARVVVRQFVAAANAALVPQRGKERLRTIFMPYGIAPEDMPVEVSGLGPPTLDESGDAPAWIDTWLSAIPTAGPPSEPSVWLDATIRTHLKLLSSLQEASPDHPAYIGTSGAVFTDGEKVYVQGAGTAARADDPSEPGCQFTEYTEGPLYVLEGANPRAMRALCDEFYTDGRILWHYDSFSGTPPQALAYCEGHVPRVFLFVDLDADSLAVMGDRAWNAAYDDSKQPEHRYYVRMTEIDGATFERILDTDAFRDQFRQYIFGGRAGLQPEASLSPPEDPAA